MSVKEGMKTEEAVLNFGRIAYNGDKKIYPVTVEMELRTKIDTGVTELSVRAFVWGPSHTDFVAGGQCLDELVPFFPEEDFQEIYRLWKDWHLGGMHAGTPEQEKALREYRNEHPDALYTEWKQFLKDQNLDPVIYTGMSCDGKIYDHEPYYYGSDWLYVPIPDDVLKRIHEIMDAGRKSDEKNRYKMPEGQVYKK